MQPILIETMTLPPIPVVSAIVKHSGLILEAHENYQKRSFRNRFYLAGPNGPQMFTVPLIKGKHEQLGIRDVRISYDEPWHEVLLKAIQSAYGSAPYFEHLFDDLAQIIATKESFLFDFNLSLYHFLGQYITALSAPKMSESYHSQPTTDFVDQRDSFRPGKSFFDRETGVSYVQVFADRYPFIPNLSILDLLMCLGPESELRLQENA